MSYVPEGATHYDTHPFTQHRFHKRIDGDWAYNRGGLDDWKVYDIQDHATTDFFITIEEYLKGE